MPPPELPSRLCTLRIDSLVRDDRLRFRDAAHKAIGPVQEYADKMRGDPEAEGYAGPEWRVDVFKRAVCLDLTETFSWEEEEPAKGPLGKPRRVRRDYPAGTTLLVGGFTRCEAGDIAGVTHAPAVVYAGTWADALRLAFKENTEHGARRSRMETEMVLLAIHLIPEYAAMTTREVAELAGCSQPTVHRYRQTVKSRADEFAEATKRAEQFAASDRAPTSPPPPLVVPSPPPASPPAPTHTAGEIVPVDAWKRPLPPGVVEPFAVLGPVGKLIRSLRADAKALAQLKHGHDGTEKCVAPGLVKADVVGVLAAVTTACDAVEADLPFLVCPDCDGSGKAHGTGKRCKGCDGLGWVGKGQADLFTPTQEKAASKFRGAV